MPVLVTGSSGFIGSHLVAALTERGDIVLGLDKRPPAARNPHSEFAHCDILQTDRLLAVFHAFSPEAVVHLAARTDLDEKDSLAGYAANIEGVESLIVAVRQTPSIKRAIYTSTQLVCRVGYQPKSDVDYTPNTLYGQSKVLGEQIVRRSDGGGVTWCITRPTTVWGPGMSDHYQRFFGLIRQGAYFHVGHKPLLKSFGYVGNVVHQYLPAPGGSGGPDPPSHPLCG